MSSRIRCCSAARSLVRHPILKLTGIFEDPEMALGAREMSDFGARLTGWIIDYWPAISARIHSRKARIFGTLRRAWG
jgi:hypothetical protein